MTSVRLHEAARCYCPALNGTITGYPEHPCCSDTEMVKQVTCFHNITPGLVVKLDQRICPENQSQPLNQLLFTVQKAQHTMRLSSDKKQTQSENCWTALLTLEQDRQKPSTVNLHFSSMGCVNSWQHLSHSAMSEAKEKGYKCSQLTLDEFSFLKLFTRFQCLPVC